MKKNSAPTNNVNMLSNKSPVKQEIKKRVNLIVAEINSMTDKLNLDTILETFKSNEILKEFYMKRIFEVLNVKQIFYFKVGNPKL